MWQLSAGLGVVLALSLGGFKMYYDKTEAQKDALVTQIKQASENQRLLEATIADQNAQIDQQKKVREAQSRCAYFAETQADRENYQSRHC